MSKRHINIDVFCDHPECEASARGGVAEDEWEWALPAGWVRFEIKTSPVSEISAFDLCGEHALLIVHPWMLDDEDEQDEDEMAAAVRRRPVPLGDADALDDAIPLEDLDEGDDFDMRGTDKAVLDVLIGSRNGTWPQEIDTPF